MAFTVIGLFEDDVVTVNWIDGRVETPGNNVWAYIEYLAKRDDVPTPVYAPMPDVEDKLSDPLAAFLVIRAALSGGILKTLGDVPKIPGGGKYRPGVVI